jgi:hypothetical protein
MSRLLQVQNSWLLTSIPEKMLSDFARKWAFFSGKNSDQPVLPWTMQQGSRHPRGTSPDLAVFMTSPYIVSVVSGAINGFEPSPGQWGHLYVA